MTLKLINNTLPVFFVLMAGCSSSSYKVMKTNERQVELLVTPDRVVLECQKLDDPERSYGFMIHVLDDAQTVFTVLQGNKLDKESCFRRFTYIGKMLKKGRQIYIGGMGRLKEDRKKGDYKYIFPKHGTFFDNGRTLQFAVIMNEHGMCYDAYSGPEKPCPREQFPIKD